MIEGDEDHAMALVAFRNFAQATSVTLLIGPHKNRGALQMESHKLIIAYLGGIKGTPDWDDCNSRNSDCQKQEVDLEEGLETLMKARETFIFLMPGVAFFFNIVLDAQCSSRFFILYVMPLMAYLITI